MVNLFGYSFGKKSAKRFTVDSIKNKSSLMVDRDTITLREYLNTDPDLSANIRRFIDNVLIESPELEADEDSKVADSTIRNYNKQLSKVRFYKLMRTAFFNLIVYGNAFFEVRFQGKELKEMYVIDADTIRIKENNHGEIIRYEQWIGGEGPRVTFTPDEIIHLTIDHLDTGVWGHSVLKPLKDTLQRKAIAESYLHWLIANNKLAPIVNIKADNMQEEAWTHIISQFNAKNTDPDLYQIINSLPEDTIDLVKVFTTDDFDRITKYIEMQNRQIMTLLQVPPIVSGTVDNSNRSNSEIQAKFVFYNSIRAFQNIIIDELNFNMVEKLKWKGVEFVFKAMDERVNVETIKMAKSLRQDLGFTQEAIKQYLIEHDFDIPKVDKLFEDPMVDLTNPEARISYQAGQNGNTQDKSSALSRQPRDKTGLVTNEAKRIEDKQMGVSSNAN